MTLWPDRVSECEEHHTSRELLSEIRRGARTIGAPECASGKREAEDDWTR